MFLFLIISFSGLHCGSTDSEALWTVKTNDEINALVAAELGLKRDKIFNPPVGRTSIASWGQFIGPNYCGDIAVAWELVEELRSFYCGFSLGSVNDNFEKMKWLAKFEVLKPKYDVFFAFDDVISKAIALAFLKSRGVCCE